MQTRRMIVNVNNESRDQTVANTAVYVCAIAPVNEQLTYDTPVDGVSCVPQHDREQWDNVLFHLN